MLEDASWPQGDPEQVHPSVAPLERSPSLMLDQTPDTLDEARNRQVVPLERSPSRHSPSVILDQRPDTLDETRNQRGSWHLAPCDSLSETCDFLGNPFQRHGVEHGFSTDEREQPGASTTANRRGSRMRSIMPMSAAYRFLPWDLGSAAVAGVRALFTQADRPHHPDDRHGPRQVSAHQSRGLPRGNIGVSAPLSGQTASTAPAAAYAPDGLHMSEPSYSSEDREVTETVPTSQALQTPPPMHASAQGSDLPCPPIGDSSSSAPHTTLETTTTVVPVRNTIPPLIRNETSQPLIQPPQPLSSTPRPSVVRPHSPQRPSYVQRSQPNTRHTSFEVPPLVAPVSFPLPPSLSSAAVIATSAQSQGFESLRGATGPALPPTELGTVIDPNLGHLAQSTPRQEQSPQRNRLFSPSTVSQGSSPRSHVLPSLLTPLQSVRPAFTSSVPPPLPVSLSLLSLPLPPSENSESSPLPPLSLPLMSSSAQLQSVASATQAEISPTRPPPIIQRQSTPQDPRVSQVQSPSTPFQMQSSSSALPSGSSRPFPRSSMSPVHERPASRIPSPPPDRAMDTDTQRSPLSAVSAGPGAARASPNRQPASPDLDRDVSMEQGTPIPRVQRGQPENHDSPIHARQLS